MGFANWRAGGADPVVARLQAPSWVHLVGCVAQPPRPINLALPCCGIDGAGHVCAALGMPRGDLCAVPWRHFMGSVKDDGISIVGKEYLIFMDSSWNFNAFLKSPESS
jgi:hypothetical protein